MRALHLIRESLVQDKVKTTNQMHAFLLEFGISVSRGAAVIGWLSTILENSNLPQYPSQLLQKLQQHYLVEHVKDLEYLVETKAGRGSKPTYRQNQYCKNGSDHRFRFPSPPPKNKTLEIKNLMFTHINNSNFIHHS